MSTEALRDLRDGNITAGTRNNYIRDSTRFIVWLATNKPELLTSQFTDVSDPKEIRNSLKAHDRAIPPIFFERILPEDFIQYILSLKKADGSLPGWSVYNANRSALSNLFRDYGQTMNAHLESELTIYFKSLKRRTTAFQQAGDSSIKTGKDPLSYSHYTELCLQSLKQADPRYIFFHLFLVLSWNLTCRSKNVVTIQLSHIEWHDDGLAIYFAHQKNDQAGDKPRDPRHIFANPLNPSVCPILALGLFWVLFPGFEGELFSGGRQYDRYRKTFQDVLRLPEVAADLQRRGIDPTSLGSHSARKGAATYVSSGSTCSPSHAAICIRVGWALPGVQETYLRYDSAADAYVGRTVCGLPITSPDFALLPPLFSVYDREVNTAIDIAFPGIPSHLRRTAEFALASLIYHRNFLVRTMPHNHPIFCSALFRDQTLIQSLETRILCRRFQTGDPVVPTGIPPHVIQLCDIRDLAIKLADLPSIIETVAPTTVSAVMSLLEERAIQAAAVTPAALSRMMADQFDQVRELIQSLRYDPNMPNTQSTSSDNQPSSVYLWGGKLHLLPENFGLPNGGTHVIWSWWCLGDPQNGIPPLRTIRPSDLATEGLKKRFSDMKYLATQIQSNLSDRHISWSWHELTESTAQELLQQSDILSELHLQSKKRRIVQLGWRTVVKLVREKRRRRE